MVDKVPAWAKGAANVLFTHCNSECDTKRKYMLPIWKRAEYYWNDIQDIFWNESANDWYTYDEEDGETAYDAIRDNNKIINTYRAYGESIIAAATMGNLSIKFFPANADDPADLDKSRNFSDIADYLQRVNNVRELRRKAFVIRWNQGLVGSYVYYERDGKKYGTYKKNVIGSQKSTVISKQCTECDANIPSQRISSAADALNELQNKPVVPPEIYQPGAPPSPQIPPLNEQNEIPAPPPQQETCPECGAPVETNESEEDIPQLLGSEEIDKGCSRIELYSPLQMKLPFYARKPSDVNYCIIEGEVHYATARAMFPDFADQINPGVDPVESHKRAQADIYLTLSSNNLVTIQELWCKPDMYNVLVGSDVSDTELAQIKKECPDGLHLTKIRDITVEAENFDFDAHWTFVESPLDTHIYIRALGNGMIPIQDMENDLVYITMDTIRHEIGETFVDSRVLDFKRYAKSMTRPGNKYPINNVDRNKPLQEYFYSTSNASLSAEVDRFHERLEGRGQLVTGAFPSIYGGMFAQGSKTLGVYDLSRAQALQRIDVPQNGIDDFLTATIHKATILYDRAMEGDESVSVAQGDSYRNVTLRKSAPNAKIARVETMKSEQFPTTWEQKRQFIMDLLDKHLDPINATVFSPDNVSLMARIIGVPELKVPGDADRNKMLAEIQKMLTEQPIQPPLMPPNQPPPPPQPSIMPDFDIDNNTVCIQTIKTWAVSREGQLEKIRNNAGYENVLAQLKARMQYEQMQQQALTPPSPTSKPNGKVQNNAPAANAQ